MIKNTLLLIGTVLLGSLITLTACSSSKSDLAHQSLSATGVTASVSVKATPIREAATAKPESHSLWNSELFNDSRFQLNIQLTEREKKEAKKMARNFEAHMDSSSLFMYHLLSELKKRNLPVELAALPLVESGFNPRARSHAGAHGPWQFIRSTGKALGLERTSNYDEFYDFIESTDASLRYLEHLYRECGENWDLAVAGYNQGEFAIKKAIRRAKANGVKDINFNTVRLTAHANLYVYRFHAYADILRHPENYGVSRPEIENRPAFKRVQVAGRVNSMRQAARLSGTSLSTLKHLNAGYLSDSLKSNKQRGLLVPVENVNRLEHAIGIEAAGDKGTTLSASND